jgi:hypothetical protein
VISDPSSFIDKLGIRGFSDNLAGHQAEVATITTSSEWLQAIWPGCRPRCGRKRRYWWTVYRFLSRSDRMETLPLRLEPLDMVCTRLVISGSCAGASRDEFQGWFSWGPGRRIFRCAFPSIAFSLFFDLYLYGYTSLSSSCKTNTGTFLRLQNTIHCPGLLTLVSTPGSIPSEPTLRPANRPRSSLATAGLAFCSRVHARRNFCEW